MSTDSKFGFKFNYSRRHLSKSKPICESEIAQIASQKNGGDDIPIFVNCRSCGVYMDYKPGDSATIFDSWWVCPICGTRVKELTVMNQLSKENQSYENEIYADSDYEEYW